MIRRLTALAFALVAVPLFATDGMAQRRGARPHVTLEAYGGIADFGRFLEQAVVDLDAGTLFGQRELTGETTFSVGGSVGVHAWEKTVARLGLTFTPTELEYQDDTGTESDAFDDNDIADLTAFVVSLELLRFLLDDEARIAPYATAGVTGTFWSLDEEAAEGEIAAGEDSQFRFGGVGGIGLRFRASRRIGVRLEANTFALGNPFNGNDAFRPTSGFTIDEPSSVRMSRITLAVTYTFFRDR